MFLSYVKDFFLKRILKNRLQNVKSSSYEATIQTIGLLIDESYFFKKEALVKQLIANGIPQSNIEIIVFRDKLKKNETYSQPTFGLKHLNWNGEISNPLIKDFINTDFNLLISYYDVEKSFLLTITHNSRAHFKVGFSSIDKRLNHLMIDTNVENYKVFAHELFRYLKILNKI